jgi:hypothetical protein
MRTNNKKIEIAIFPPPPHGDLGAFTNNQRIFLFGGVHSFEHMGFILETFESSIIIM